MNVGFEKARNQAQSALPIAMARLLNVGIAVFETVTFAMSGLRSHVQLMVQMIASSIDNTYFHAGTSSTLILRLKSLLPNSGQHIY